MLLEEVGIKDLVYNIDYAFDEVNLFHFTDMHTTKYTRTCVTEADYTQIDRGLFPDTINNTRGDVFLDSTGYLHVITSTSYFGYNHNDLIYRQMDYIVYDVRQPGQAPVEVYHKPISFGNVSNTYFVRMTESTSGNVHILAMDDEDGRCEIWRETSKNSHEFELVGVKHTGIKPRNSHIIGNSRNGSVVDDTISVAYPSDWSGSYRTFTVTIK